MSRSLNSDRSTRIEATINGTPYVLHVAPNARLIDILRNELELTGTKEGCGVGVCGACTIHFNGKTASACLILAVMADGAEITTIEGLAEGGKLDPVQVAFLSGGGVQCGFCTPGQIMAAKALLDQNPDPSEAEIKEAMIGNLCRCTGYYAIIECVRRAAESQREGRA